MRPDSTLDPRPPGEPAEPGEGRPDLELPGADRPDPAPDSGDGDDLPQRLGERIYGGPGQGIATGEPDIKPDVEIPDATM